MDYLYRSARILWLDRIRNEEVRNRMEADDTILNPAERRSLKWFGHLL